MDCPLIFTSYDLVPGQGFVAQVTMCGRVLAVREDDGTWWFYGVEPGALAEGGATPQEAYARFRASIRKVLEDVAAEASGFDRLATEVKRLFRQVDTEEAARWDAAVRAFRAGERTAEEPFKGLPSRPASSQFTVEVQKIESGPSFQAITSPSEESLLQAA